MSIPTHEGGDARPPRVDSSRRLRVKNEERASSDHAADAARFVSPLVRLLAPGSQARDVRKDDERAHVPKTPLEWVLYDFISFAHAMRVDCCFLRGYEHLPSPPPHAKIHMLVRPAHVAELMRLFEQASRRHGAAIIDRWSGAAVTGFTLYAYRAPADHSFVEIDVHTEITCESTPYLAAEEVLPGRHYARDLRIPLPVHEAVIQLLDRWLGDGELAPDDVRPAEKSARQHPRHFQEVMRELLGARLAHELAEHVARGTLALLAEDAPRFRRALIRRAWNRRPLRCAGTRVAQWMRRFCQPITHPRGRFIVVLGDDDGARFAILEWLAKELRFMVQGRASVFDSSREGAPNRDEPEQRARGRKKRGLLTEWVRCLWIYVRAVLRHRDEHALILRDDYPYADLMEPMRAGVRRGSTLARCLSKCTPHPDVVLMLPRADERATHAGAPAEDACRVYSLGAAGFAPLDSHGRATGARERILCAVLSGGSGT